MKRKIIVNNKEYAMPRMDVDTYMEYLELSEKIDGKPRYTRMDIEAMLLFIVKAYGDQFTVEELKDKDTGIDAAGIVLEFQFIDVGVAEEWRKIFRVASDSGNINHLQHRESIHQFHYGGAVQEVCRINGKERI